MTPQGCVNFIKNNMTEFYKEKCFKHKDNKIGRISIIGTAAVC